MIRDVVRAALAVAVMAVAAGLLVETRFHLAAIDVAHRQAIQPATMHPHETLTFQARPEQPGRLRQLGRATLDLADAALGVIR
jgi:hypothetical protein